MTDDASSQRKLILEAGQTVILHPDGPAGGFPMIVTVDHVEDGQHWFLGSVAPIQRGETLIVESPVPGEARYVTRASVAASSKATFALELEPSWQRVQQRAFIRISAHGLAVRLVRLSSPEVREALAVVAATTNADTDAASQAETETNSPQSGVHELLDISAGGIRFAADIEYEADEEVICHFELPGSLCFVLPGRIVRGNEASSALETKPGTAVEFVGLDETNRSQLLRWIYREQVRRHREEQREEERARAEAERLAASKR